MTATTALGLTSEQAAARLAEDGPNALPDPKAATLPRRIALHLVEPLSLLLIAASLLSVFVLGEIKEGIAILAIVVLDAAVGTVQGHRADQAVAALRGLTAPTAKVWRDGVLVRMPAGEIVAGDVVELAAGDRVPADVVLVDAVAYAVDEAVMTGESMPVDKLPGDPSIGGSSVVRGRGVGEVVATGPRSRLGLLATSMEGSPPPPLQVELARVSRILAAGAVVLGIVLVPVAAYRVGGSDRWFQGILAGVSLAVAAIPEGLPAAVTAALALGAQRMARKGAIVRQLAAVETLGSMSVLCTDKTGTLTTGEIDVVAVHPAEGREQSFWDAIVRCNDAPRGGEDPVDVALVRAAPEEALGRRGTRIDERPFDARTRMMTTIDEVDGDLVMSVKGAPELVLARARDADRALAVALHAAADDAAANGRRVLAVADADGTDVDGPLRVLGLVELADPLRSSAAGAVDSLRSAGVRVVLVTGDHRTTAAAIASTAGLEAGPVVVGSELSRLDAAARPAALAAASVVARVEPDLKVDLVRAHRERGHVVGMTGDGVNDAPALRQADVGVALAGAAGTDVAREAADLVVTDGDLGTVVAAVREGRRIYRNLTSVVSYLVSGNLSEIAVVTAGVVLLPELAVPLLPVQLLWVNLVTDGLPAVALGADDPPDDLMDDPPRPSGARLLDGRRLAMLGVRGLMMAVVVVATAMVARQRGWTAAEQRTQLFTTLVFVHLALVYVARADRWSFTRQAFRNRGLLVAVGGSTLLQVLMTTVPLFRSWLDLASLPGPGWVLVALAVPLFVVGVDLTRRWTTFPPATPADRARAPRG